MWTHLAGGSNGKHTSWPSSLACLFLAPEKTSKQHQSSHMACSVSLCLFLPFFLVSSCFCFCFLFTQDQSIIPIMGVRVGLLSLLDGWRRPTFYWMTEDRKIWFVNPVCQFVCLSHQSIKKTALWDLNGGKVGWFLTCGWSCEPTLKSSLQNSKKRLLCVWNTFLPPDDIIKAHS